MLELAKAFRILGDETRLRILRVLQHDSLNVGELTQVLGLAQPSVSKQLRELRRAELVEGSKNGSYTYYHLSSLPPVWWTELARQLQNSEDSKGDFARLQEIKNQREELSESSDRFVVPGRSWVAWSRALRFLLPALRVADFGCGDGAFTFEISAWAEKVFAIDQNGSLLEQARGKAGDRRGRIEFLEEDMSNVSIGDGAVDLVVISQSLHFVEDPPSVLAEAYRILSEPGTLLLLDLLPHHQDWVVRELDHRWKGFEASQLKAWLRKTGFCDIESDCTIKQGPDPFRILILKACRDRGGGS